MKTNALKILILFIFVSNSGYTQLRSSPKKLKFKDEFIHSETKTEFPKNIDDYILLDAYSFDKKDENVGVTYEKENTKISIYIYPDKIGNEGRLRNEFLSAYSVIFNNDTDVKNLKIIHHIGEKYTCNGVRGISKNSNNENSLLTIFECGTWLYKIRITSSELTNQNLIDIETKITNKIEPTTLTILQSGSTGLPTLAGQPLPIFPELEKQKCENPDELEDVSVFIAEKVQMIGSAKATTLPSN